MDGIPDTRLGALPNLSYGYLFGEPPELPHLRGTGRSGLSPSFMPPPNEHLSLTEETLPLYDAERAYQKTKLAGYTSSTLHAMGALEKPNAKASNLTNDVHPLFDKCMWAPEGIVPLDYGLEGKYNIDNDLVWNAVLPSLRLASKFLENVHCWPWWDALVHGEVMWIPRPPGTPDTPRWSFHARRPEEIFKDGLVVDEDFVERYADRIGYQINIASPEWRNQETGRSVHSHTMGFTQWLPEFNISRITLAAQMIAPLLRDNISNSQRLVLQYQLTRTILHELAHTIGILLTIDSEGPAFLQFGEPFFEDEIIAELGESMETATTGGRIWSYPSNVSSRAYMITAVQSWPNYALLVEKHNLGLTAQIKPGSERTFGPGSEQSIMAIPISWMESLFQADFWEIYVRQFGADAMRPYPRLLINSSVIVEIDGAGLVKRKMVSRFGPEFVTYLEAKYSGEVEVGGNAVEALAYRMDGERVAEAYRQCAVFEQAVAWFWARTGIWGEA